MPIPTLSLWQPWASLWAHGQKKIETRGWPLRLRLPCVLAVHAAKTCSYEVLHGRDGAHFRAALEQIPAPPAVEGEVAPPLAWDRLPLGAVVGLVRVVEMVGTRLIFYAGGAGLPCLGAKYLVRFPEERAFGDYRPGRYGFVADRFKPLAFPFPLRGQQGVFPWAAPPEIEAEARRLLEGCQ